MVQAWIEIHKDELFADWELAIVGEQPFRIEKLPLSIQSARRYYAN